MNRRENKTHKSNKGEEVDGKGETHRTNIEAKRGIEKKKG